jgi:hypothetical protein
MAIYQKQKIMASFEMLALCNNIISFLSQKNYIVSLRIAIKSLICCRVAEFSVSSISSCNSPFPSLFLCTKMYVGMRVKFDSLSRLVVVVFNASDG